MTIALEQAERQLGGTIAVRYGSVQPFTEGHLANYASLACLLSGDDRAETFTRHAVGRYDLPGDRQRYKMLALARINLATALLHRRRPHPDQAATVALQAISAPPVYHNGPVGRRARELLAMMAGWRARPAVRQFAEELRAYRPVTLPALTAWPEPQLLPAPHRADQQS